MKTETHVAFHAAMKRHYQGERDRSEKCLGDIIEILQKQLGEDEQIDEIVNRLISHYDR